MRSHPNVIVLYFHIPYACVTDDYARFRLRDDWTNNEQILNNFRYIKYPVVLYCIMLGDCSTLNTVALLSFETSETN
jgi:hypothetical protein